jgi:hypothetical protein
VLDVEVPIHPRHHRRTYGLLDRIAVGERVEDQQRRSFSIEIARRVDDGANSVLKQQRSLLLILETGRLKSRQPLAAHHGARQ